MNLNNLDMALKNNLVYQAILKNKFQLFFAIIISICSNVCQFIFLIDLPEFIKELLSSDEIKLENIYSEVIIILLLCVLNLSYRYRSKILAANTAASVSESIIKFNSSITLKEFQKIGKEKVTALATLYLDSVINSIVKPLPNTINSIFTVLIGIYIIFKNIGISIITILIPMLLILIILIYLTRNKTLHYGKIVTKQTESMYIIMNFFIGNIKEILIHGNHKYYSIPLSKQQYRKTISEGKSEFIANGPQEIIQTFMYLSIILLPFLLSLTGIASPSDLIPSLTTILLAGEKIPKKSMQVYRTILKMINIWPTLSLYNIPNDSNFQINKLSNITDKKSNSSYLISNSNIMSSINVSKLLIGHDKKNPLIYIDSLNIKASSSFIIYGKSGCGKTTLLETLIGLRDPLKGDSHFLDKNNKPINNFRSISYVPQVFDLPASNIIDCFAFTQPELRNYRHNPLIHAKIRDVLDMCLIWDEFIFSMKDLHNFLGNGCISLSGGQRQRVAIARSILQDNQIIVLDEATGALDKRTELTIVKNILSKGNDKTFLFVSHSSQLIPLFDRCYNLEEI